MLGGLDSGQDASAALTRGRLAQLLTAFSAWRESTGGSAGTLFTDVDGTDPLASGIRTAVQQGWMSGYSDGSFRPDQAVTLEEACAAALSLLGYDVTTLSGTFPDAQLNKARELGLREGLSAGQGDTLTIAQGAQLLYNALTAVTAEGETYGTTLGLAVTDGQRGHRPRHQRLRHRSPGRNCGPDGEGRHHHHLHHLLFLRRREWRELPERH